MEIKRDGLKDEDEDVVMEFDLVHQMASFSL
jgi:hypothetical protein